MSDDYTTESYDLVTAFGALAVLFLMFAFFATLIVSIEAERTLRDVRQDNHRSANQQGRAD